MNRSSRKIRAGLLRSCTYEVISAGLCLALVLPANALPFQPGVPGAAAPKPRKSAKLTQQQRVLHALNRFTFGPRPGDEAAVAHMGLDAWFRRQLEPERISDAGLDARLAQFPAMQLSQSELVARLPTPEMLRQYSRGAIGTPGDPVEHAIYADAALRYEEKVKGPQVPQMANVKQGVDGPAGAEVNGAMEPMSTEGMESILRLPPADRMQRLIAMAPEEMQSLQDALKGPDRQRLYRGLSPEQIEQVAAMQSPERVVGAEILSTRLLRDVYSERQLQAVMTDFWLNHFNVYLRKNQNEPYLLSAYEQQAIRPNALGRFEDLLVAVAKSPAMLVYLDNWESIGPNSKAAQRFGRAQQMGQGAPLAKPANRMPKGINENYARELMELHTLGVNGGYTQQDVIEVAKCFTGWTVDRPGQGGEFTYNQNRHEPGSKTVLGHVIPENSENEGLEVLHILATSPATAHFVSLKLAQRFVSDSPPAKLVNRMSKSFLKSDGDMKAVLWTMFHSPEFWSPEAFQAKVKTPLEFVTSALRAGGADVVNPVPLVQALDRLGMPLYGMQTPNGYSWQSDAWVSSNALLTRLNFALVLSGGRLQGTRVDWSALDPALNPSASDPVAEQRLEQSLLGQPAAERTREAVLAGAANPTAQGEAERSFASRPAIGAGSAAAAGMVRVKTGRPGTAPESSIATMAGLLLGSPDFQRR